MDGSSTLFGLFGFFQCGPDHLRKDFDDTAEIWTSAANRAYPKDVKADLINSSTSSDDEEPLLGTSSYVQDLGCSAVDSERVIGDRFQQRSTGRRDLEALATPPVELSHMLPQDYQPGQMVRMHGPHGIVEVDAPENAAPGVVVRFRLAPKPEFRIQVPSDAPNVVKFKRADGIEVAVGVPGNLMPGDHFEVTPPALMVKVPDGAQAGDYVMFRHSLGNGADNAMEQTVWLRSKVPESLYPGQYFAARMPLPPQGL